MYDYDYEPPAPTEEELRQEHRDWMRQHYWWWDRAAYRLAEWLERQCSRQVYRAHKDKNHKLPPYWGILWRAEKYVGKYCAIANKRRKRRIALGAGGRKD